MYKCIFFGPKCNIKFVSNIKVFQRNKSMDMSNETLIKSRAKLCRPISYNNPPVWDLFFEEKHLSVTLNAITTGNLEYNYS